LKSRVAHAGLEAMGLVPGDGRADPIRAVSCVGDPMQPLVAGIAVGVTSRGGDVLLAGGSQMIAVVALIDALGVSASLEHLAIGTTRWVVEDPASDVAGLMHEVCEDLPLLAVNLNFGGSRHAGLRAYEGFVVKEGVGAGGACIAALLSTGASRADLMVQIESVYDELLGRLSTSDSADSRRR
jgi:NaMN:DMB phosphoribosyltransferase